MARRPVSPVSYSPVSTSFKFTDSINLKAFENNGCSEKYFSAFGKVSIITGIFYFVDSVDLPAAHSFNRLFRKLQCL